MKFLCSHCGAEMVAPDGFEGMAVECAQCGEETFIPKKKRTAEPAAKPAIVKEPEPLALDIDPDEKLSEQEVEWLRERIKHPSPEHNEGRIKIRALPIRLFEEPNSLFVDPDMPITGTERVSAPAPIHAPRIPEPSRLSAREAERPFVDTDVPIIETRSTSAQAPAAQSVGDGLCPICRSRPAEGHTLLYGERVCKSCYMSFANRRQWAFAMDFLAIFGVANIGIYTLLFIIGAVVTQDQPSDTAALLGLFFLMTYFVSVYILFAVKDGFGGYSIGKYLCGLRVLNIDTGKPIGFMESFKRNLIITFASISCFLWPALIVIGMDLNKGERLHDGWARSKVVWGRYKDKRPFWTFVRPQLRGGS